MGGTVSRECRRVWIFAAAGVAIGLTVSSCAQPMSSGANAAAASTSTSLLAGPPTSSSGVSSARADSATMPTPTSRSVTGTGTGTEGPPVDNTLYISCPAKISLTSRLADSSSDPKSNGTWVTGVAKPTGTTAIIHQQGTDAGDLSVYSQVEVHISTIISGRDMNRDVEAWVSGGTTPEGSSTDARGAGIALGAGGQFFGALIPTTAELGNSEGSYLINALPVVDGSVLSVEEGCLPFPDTGQHVKASVTVFENGRLQARPEADYAAVSLKDVQRAAS